LKKINILLKACERAGKAVEYSALDPSLSELERTFSEIPVDAFRHVKFSALHGTYDDGLDWLSKTVSPATPTCVLTLGSSIGNFSREEAAAFLQSFARVLGPADLLLVGLDACQTPEKVYQAYNDGQGLTHKFYRNGLDHANKLLGYAAFKQEDWDVVGKYNEAEGRHEAFYQARNDVSVAETTFKKGDKLELEEAYKYSAGQREKLWHTAGLIEQTAYANQTGDYRKYKVMRHVRDTNLYNSVDIHLLSPVRVAYPTKSYQYAAQPVPSVTDWQSLWIAWDTVTRAMIPKAELMDKPIKLRNSLIFYLGHIPTFAGKCNQVCRPWPGS
jgi:EasF-like predicted methyltransferase